ncbi:hypothetical protein PTNB73_07004 [Pyrenophora teres f. teres]|nr:hypothetical protein PTNB73_07004 [Pyrenophora teres f. teres]
MHCTSLLILLLGIARAANTNEPNPKARCPSIIAQGDCVADDEGIFRPQIDPNTAKGPAIGVCTRKCHTGVGLYCFDWVAPCCCL